MSVFVTGADFGVVRFIGTTQFAKGVWLGIELRKPSKYILLTHEASLSSRLNARIFSTYYVTGNTRTVMFYNT